MTTTEDRAPVDLPTAPDPRPGGDVTPEGTACDRELVVTHRQGAVTFLAPADPTFRAARPRNDSLCGVLLERHVRPRPADAPTLAQVIEVRDTADDPTLPQLVHGVADSAPVRFYAAAPLYDGVGVPLGTLCVIAHHPRTLTDTERRTLLLLGVAASTVLVRCRQAQGG